MYQLFYFAGLLCFLSCGPDGDPTTEEDDRPLNVVFILADDLGYHDLGATGSEFYETPNLDKLAKRSIVFDRAYAGSRVCSPSRATLLLGEYTATHGITDWIGAAAGEDWRNANRFTTHLPAQYARELPDSALTLAEAFQQNGYRTFFAGKWHLGGEGSMPTNHGFDVNVGGNDTGSPAGGYFDPYDNPDLPNRRPGENLSMRLASETKNFIVTQQDRPFFAMLSFYAVHGPIQTTEEHWRHYRDKAVEGKPADHAYEMERRLPIRTVQDNPVYGGLVTQLDDAVGLVLDALDSLGLAKNTLVVFTSDNGGVASGDAYSTSNLPLRGGKGYQWEGGTREPLFMRIGNRVRRGTVEARVTGADLYPTLLSLAGIDVDPPQPIDGSDLTPLIEGEDWAERPLYFHYPHYGNQGGDPSSELILGDWKLIHYWETDTDELYDLGRDPQEQANVAESNADRTTQLRTQLLAFLEERGAAYPTTDPAYDAVGAEAKATAYRDELLPRLEAERTEMFREDWSPNADWWGSGE